jgi:hypothetical protein
MNLHDNMNEMRHLGVGPDRLWRFVRERNLKEHNKRVDECRARMEPRVVTRAYGVEESDDGVVWSNVKLQVDPMQQALRETADTNADAARKIEELESSLRIQSRLIEQLREGLNQVLVERNAAEIGRGVLRGVIDATVAERDDARRTLALTERKLSVWVKRSDEGFASFRENVERLSSERDKALAERDELRTKLAEAQQHSPIGYVHRQMYSHVVEQRDKALADLAAARESENRFRGEVAALKARKVKLPDTNVNYINGYDSDVHRCRVVAIAQCADAIRAAGVEVES